MRRRHGGSLPKALVLTGHDLTSWRTEFARGAAPAALPYEVDALESSGFDLTVRSNIHSLAVTKLRAKIEHRTQYGVALPVQAAPAVLRNDIVIALLEREGGFPAILRGRRIPPYSKRPLVIYSWRLAYDVLQASRDERRHLVDRYSAADLITHMSPRESEILVDAGFRAEQLFGVTFGVSHRYYLPGSEEERDIDILAVGQDHGRDYATLFAAIEGTDLSLDVVCRPENLVGLRVPDNVGYAAPSRTMSIGSCCGEQELWRFPPMSAPTPLGPASPSKRPLAGAASSPPRHPRCPTTSPTVKLGCLWGQATSPGGGRPFRCLART